MSRSDLGKHPAVSFTVKRPSPLSRNTSDSSAGSSFKAPALSNKAHGIPTSSPLTVSAGRATGTRRPAQTRDDNDSSDEDAGTEDEIITGFDSLGVQRAKEKPIEGPLVIPALANRDWRAAARRRQSAAIFVPEAGRAAVGVGADGSVGGLGTRDTINSGPQLSGIVSKKSIPTGESPQPDGTNPSLHLNDDVDVVMAVQEVESHPEQSLTEDQRALQAILAGDQVDIPQIDIIPALPSERGIPKTETDAYREDVLTRPESATREDYERIPVEQFGAALLRGMGWKEGMAASKTRKGPVEPYVPVSRPALLGIGAKEKIVDEDVGPSKNRKSQRPEKRYVPVVKRGRDGTIIADDPKSNSHSVTIGRSDSSSRRASRSPPRRESERAGDRNRDREYSARHYDQRDERYSQRGSDSDRPRERERDRDKRRDDYGDDKKPRDRERDRDKDRYQEKSRDRDRERSEYSRDGDRHDKGSARSGRDESDKYSRRH